ncbi:MAG: GAF domain-containing protein [Actinomycetota bacterium]|nr:GAF domain-containing protein [Actinomycetota bacterium]
MPAEDSRTVDQHPPATIATLDLLVDVLSQADESSEGTEFYSRLAGAVCDLTGMQRAVIFTYDDARRRAHPSGARGISLDTFDDVHITMESAPMARRALKEDRVIEMRPGADHEFPPQFAELVGDHPLIYIPIAAANRWMGVILADPGPGAAPLDDERRGLLWTLGKTVALARSSRISTFHSERARGLEQRIDLAREIHDGVIQRLFGVLLALSSASSELDAAARQRCALEVRTALEDLRDALQRPLGRPSRVTGTTLALELDRLRAEHSDLNITVDGSIPAVPDGIEALAQSVLTEAIRNARKHSSAARVLVRSHRKHGTFVLEIENDGVTHDRHASTGVGLRLAALEALQAGGLVEFGERQPGTWQVRLVVPEGGHEVQIGEMEDQ